MSVVINGSAGVTTNSGAVYNGISAGTAVASTSGTSIDFTGIPAWVKRVTVMFNGVSTNGSSLYQIQIGSGSVDTTSTYVGSQTHLTGTATTTVFTTGFLTGPNPSATTNSSGIAVIAFVSANIWTFQGSLGRADGALGVSAGVKSISGTLDRIRITTVNGTDTFDAGSINILYE